jgi:hypothetical protein
MRAAVQSQNGDDLLSRFFFTKERTRHDMPEVIHDLHYVTDVLDP